MWRMRIAVIGNSAAAISGIEAFRRYDQKSSITLISRETHLPYSRVLLPYFLLGRIDRREIFYRSPCFYDEMNVEPLLGRSVVEMDTPGKTLHLDDGRMISFDRLLISSGSSPVKPRIPGLDHPEIGHLWTLEDAFRIDQHLGAKKRLLIIGAGFISLMLAWAALQREMKVTLVELLPHVMPQTLDKKAAGFLEAEIRKTGTRVLTSTSIEAIESRSKGQYIVYPSNHRSFKTDMVIVAAGVQPNVEFVDGDHLVTDTGILVNHRMETNVPDVYAAGDVAQGPTAHGNPHCIHALWTTAVQHGKVAGSNMAGRQVDYQGSLAENVSEFFHMTVASIGDLQESTIVTRKEYVDSERGLYVRVFLKGDIPVGGLMLGSPDDVASFGVLKSLILEQRALPDLETLTCDVAGRVWHSAFLQHRDSLLGYGV
jgi:nitrite reductase (NADH) large subunit